MNKRINIRKASAAIIVLNAVEITAVLAALAYSATHGRSLSGYKVSHLDMVFFLVIFLVMVNSFVTIRDRYLLLHVEKQYQMLQDTFAGMEVLNNTLRAQRHDFLNHLQVVHSLIEMDDYGEARDYIGKVFHDIQKVGRFLKTSNPAVNALLQAKVLQCEKEDIQVVLKVASQLKDITIPSWELCRVLGNLLDNAIDALQERRQDRRISIDITEDLTAHGLRVADNGPVIREELLGRIFKPGFTTKGDQGEGMGLAIVQEILGRYGGSVRVESQEEYTAFTCSIPKGEGQIAPAELEHG